MTQGTISSTARGPKTPYDPTSITNPPQSKRPENPMIPECPTIPEMKTPSAPGPNPFDVASLRLKGDFAANIGVKKAVIAVPVRKPDKSAFVRVRPGEDHQLATFTIEVREERGETLYLVAPPLIPDLGGESSLKPKAIFTAIDRQDVLFLWPVKLVGGNDRPCQWSQSAIEAAKLAEKSWVRVQANMGLQAYDCSVATGQLPEPDWPETSFQELLQVAFKDRYIDSLDHPVLRKLRGEI